MANELTISGSITFNATNDATPQVSALNVSTTGTRVQRAIQSVTASDVAIALGPMAGTLGWFIFVNLSATITITVKTATSGTAILSLLPGEMAMGRFGSGVTAPAIVGSAVAASAFSYAIYEA